MAEQRGQQQQGLGVVRLPRQNRVHPLAGVRVFLPEQQERGEFELGLAVAGVEFGHDGVCPECVLGVAQLKARLRQHQVRRDHLRVDLDGVLELDFGVLKLAFIEVLLALGEIRLLLLLVGRTAGNDHCGEKQKDGRHFETTHAKNLP